MGALRGLLAGVPVTDKMQPHTHEWQATEVADVETCACGDVKVDGDVVPLDRAASRAAALDVYQRTMR